MHSTASARWLLAIIVVELVFDYEHICSYALPGQRWLLPPAPSTQLSSNIVMFEPFDEPVPPLPPPGSLLLDSLKEHISTTAQDHCKAIYLHVLTTNNTAIHFYENRDFRQHHYLPYYYSIRGVLKDGFTYVLYINGGHPPWTILYPFSLGQSSGKIYFLFDTRCGQIYLNK